MPDPDARQVPLALLASTLVAAALLAAGLWLAGLGFGWIPIDPSRVSSPGGVLVTGGILFASSGLAVLGSALGYGRALRPWFIVSMLTCFVIILHWIAFGAGERNFTQRSAAYGTRAMSRPLDETSGRRVFGAVAILLDVLIVSWLVDRWRKRAGR